MMTMTGRIGGLLSLATSAFLVLSRRVVVAGAVGAVAVQVQAAPTDADCQSAWTSSSASDTCGKDTSQQYQTAFVASVDTSTFHVVAQNNRCYVEVDCLRYTDTIPTRETTFTGTTEQVKDLLNCDGRLKVGNC